MNKVILESVFDRLSALKPHIKDWDLPKETELAVEFSNLADSSILEAIALLEDKNLVELNKEKTSTNFTTNIINVSSNLF